jgi:DNA-directed RNA polymerase specialized sigma24 family protein
MNPPSDRDAEFDYETLKRVLLTSAVRILDICNLYFRHGLSAREIAARTGTTEAAVRKVIQRARRKLAGASNGTLSSRFDVLAQHTR